MQTRDDIHKIKQAMECACKSNATNAVLLEQIEKTLGDTYIVTLRANWTTIVGNSVEYTYDANNNCTIAEFYEGATLVFTQTFAYDANNNCTSITVS